MRRTNEQKGITLIALVITIIILLILSGITIQALTNTGLFENANKAKLEAKRGQIKEWLSINLLEVQSENYNKTDEEILEIARKKADSSEKLKSLGKSVTVDGELSTEEDGQTVPPYFNVIVDNDLYKVSIKEQEFIGEMGKIVPSVDFSATTTSKSITLKITTKRSQGGTVECYIKGENDSNYGTAQKATDNQYTFDNLEQGKKYTVKVVVTSGNGQKAEKEKEYTTGDIQKLETADVEFEYSVNGTVIDKKTWTNKEVKVTAKPKVDIAGYTLVTKKNDGTWQETDNQTFGENGIMYVALTDGRNYGGTEAAGNVTNIEKNAPSVNINLSATEVTTEGSITATVTQSDSESGINIGSCKWIYNTTAGNIGTNASSYTGTFTNANQNITLKSTTIGTYYLHVLSADNAGNLKETIKGPIAVKTASNAVPGSTTHTASSITYSWVDLSTIAQMISNNTNITSDTAEVTVTLNGATKTLGVGDTTTVDGKTVRILGFNHDTLTTSTAYGSATATGKAGISFEYVDFVTSSYQAMNSAGTNTNGWAAMPLRTTLNGTVYDSLSIKNYIKVVNKEYITTYNTGAKSTCSDKLWLLSCGEIWNNGYNGGNTRGYAMATEGSQYKYYKSTLGSTAYNTSTNITKKPNASNSYYWWLRSPGYSGSNRFCLVDSGGYCSHNDASNDYGVAPGFSI
jgi:hypothetical protein